MDFLSPGRNKTRVLMRMGFLISVLTTGSVRALADSDDELFREAIANAQAYDNMYTSTSGNRDRAVEFYMQAMTYRPVHPDNVQIEFRIAQLLSCAFQREKGEKPKYVEALEYYDRAADRPLTYAEQGIRFLPLRALLCAGDTCIALRRPQDAYQYYERLIDLDMEGAIEQMQKAGDTAARQMVLAAAEQIRSELRELKTVALEQTVYAAKRDKLASPATVLAPMAERHRGTDLEIEIRSMITSNLLAGYDGAIDRIDDSLLDGFDVAEDAPLPPRTPEVAAPVTHDDQVHTAPIVTGKTLCLVGIICVVGACAVAYRLRAGRRSQQ